jgi:hypothetical protein
MNQTFLDWHLGLGDALICNGLVRCLVAMGHQILLPVYERNAVSILDMFSDLGDSVETIKSGEKTYFSNRITIGYLGKHFDPNRWDESFYRQASIPFIEKWNSFGMGVGMSTRMAGGMVFIHDDAERGFNIPLSGYRPSKTESIFDHLYPLMRAGEIHCINSSFAILADLCGAKGRKYLHRYARPDGVDLPIFGCHWEILDHPL